MCRLRIKCFQLESWVYLNQYLWIRLGLWSILSQFPLKTLESWADLNQYQGIRSSWALILSQFPGRPRSHELNCFNFAGYCFSLIRFEAFFGKTFESKPPKKGTASKVEWQGAKSGQNKSNPMGRCSNHNYERSANFLLNPRPAWVFGRTRPAGGGGIPPPLPNSRTRGRS